MRSTLTGVIRKAVATAMQVAIRNALVQLDSQLTDIKDANERGKNSDDTSRTEEIKRRMQEKKQKSQAAKEEAKDTAAKRQSQFKIVTTREEEMIPWESKASVVAKEGIVKQEAKSGDNGWKSPAFDIVGNTSKLEHKGITEQKLSHY